MKDTLEDQYRDLAAVLLPEGILDFFDVSNIQKDHTGLYIHLEERNVLPQERQKQAGQLYHSKGFFPQTGIQNFPIRGKKVPKHGDS